MEHNFERLIRFESDDGTTLYGDVTDAAAVCSLVGATVTVLDGNLESGFTKTTRTATVRKMCCMAGLTQCRLGPLAIASCALFRVHRPQLQATCRGSKRKCARAEEPRFRDASAPSDSSQLAIADNPDVSAQDALDHVLGYCNCNDVSARSLQMPASVSGGQFSFCKSFDGFAPIGPVIASPGVVDDPQALALVTRVNGEQRQASTTADMIWSVRQLIAFASQGTTLKRGTLIMTGTPSGVGLFMEPRTFLKDGDVVEVSFDGLGTLRNTMQFQSK
ncbi:hypothetical protein LLEC1_03844 [Akanthomyces lecanii]|uniref:Fumarylacetoacetase-like C-terminal domain-containing protein n=1 Tax=Cordyceps confragosa TaxID=2714763 RepID=A0A179I4C8_CORDF|nr:hypothetical protein LLEC1_03844 [Akanthomyces lecanii]